jgi:hypothetical protein
VPHGVGRFGGLHPVGAQLHNVAGEDLFSHSAPDYGCGLHMRVRTCRWGQANSNAAVTGGTSKTARWATPAAASAAAAEMPANGMSRCEGKVSVCRASAPAAPAPSTATCEWVTQPCGGCARAVCAVAAAEENSRSKAARGANCMASAGGSWYQRASCCRSDSQDSTKQAFHV